MSVLSVDNSVKLTNKKTLPVKLIIKLKMTLIACMCVITLLLSDYVLMPSAEKFGESDLLPELPQLFKRKPSSVFGSNVIAQYKQFVKPEKADVVVDESKLDNTLAQHLSIEQQKQQTGLLRQLYIGNVVYRLSGIVKSTNSHNQYKAALSLTYVGKATDQTNLVTGTTDGNNTVEKDQQNNQQKPYVTLTQGDRLNIYMVESITNTRIVLNDNGRRLWLALFTPAETSEN